MTFQEICELHSHFDEFLVKLTRISIFSCLEQNWPLSDADHSEWNQPQPIRSLVDVSHGWRKWKSKGIEGHSGKMMFMLSTRPNSESKQCSYFIKNLVHLYICKSWISVIAISENPGQFWLILVLILLFSHWLYNSSAWQNGVVNIYGYRGLQRVQWFKLFQIYCSHG